MTLLIGINGFKTSGKDTAYSIINELIGAHRVAFADKLKVMAGRALGLAQAGYTDEEILALMDHIKESGSLESVIPLSEVDRRRFGVAPGGSGVVNRLTGRKYLQLFGAEARAVFGDNFWIDQILPSPLNEGWQGAWEKQNEDALTRMYPGVKTLVVTDVRYPNEAERIRLLGGLVWEVLRPGVGSDGDVSEQALPRHLVDKTLTNDGTVLDFKDTISDALAEVGR